MPIVLALGCAVIYGVADYCGGRASRRLPSITVSLIGQLASLTTAAAALLIIDRGELGGRAIAWGAVAGAAGAIALAAFYHALAQGAMTTVAPITAVTSAVIPVIVGLASGERPGAVAYVGMVVAVGAVALVSGTVGVRHQPSAPSTIALAVVAGGGFALIFIALERSGEDSGMWPLVAARVVSISLIGAIALTRGIARPDVPRAWRLPALAGVLDMSANVLYLLAVREGMLSVVVVVVALYPVSTVMLAFGLDRERVSRQQALGMALAAGALVLVSVAGADK